MIDRIITQKVKSEVLQNGMDLVGFAPVERWETAPFLLSPKAILPESKTVIVAGIHITDTWTEMGGEPDPQSLGPGGWMDQNALLDRIAYRVVRLLNEYGYKAIGVASSNIWRYRKMEGVDSWFAPDLSHMHAATAAGLAQIGWSGLAITPEYGPRVRYISIVTDAALEPTPMYDGPALCDLCMECVKACPSYALVKDFDSKPHEITIGGKLFRYANKNIWRCAWAEHFNLDLKSKTLENDHIDESNIMNEIAEAKKDAGHERGVCQKVCVPPHLRTEKGSFGRDNKKIVLNRVNPKYPDRMPTFKKMRDDIIAKAVSMGVELASVAPLNVSSKVGKAVLSQAPGLNTVVGFAFRIPREAKNVENMNSYASMPYRYALRMKMHHILLVTARMIEEMGYHAASYTGRVPTMDMDIRKLLEADENCYATHGCKIDLMAWELAENAGIGTIDKMFVTKELGEDVVVGALVTDVMFDSTQASEDLMVSKIKAPSRPEKLRCVLEDMSRQNLVSLFGVANAEIFDTVVEDLRKNVDDSQFGKGIVDKNLRPHGDWVSEAIDEDVRVRCPSEYLPEAKSVIVLGMNFPGELIENSGLEKTKQIGTYGYYTYQTTYELAFAAMKIATYLNQIGYNTYVTYNMLGMGSMIDTPRQSLPDFRCGAIEAVIAGLGELGRNGSLLTEEFGAHQRQIIIITDAELPADKIYNGNKICTECGNCTSLCPMNCYQEKSFSVRVGSQTINVPQIMRNRCDWAKRYSLHKDEGPTLIGNKTHEVPSHNGEVTMDEIAEACNKKDKVMKKRTVILEPCLRYCTAGKMKKASEEQTVK